MNRLVLMQKNPRDILWELDLGDMGRDASEAMATVCYACLAVMHKENDFGVFLRDTRGKLQHQNETIVLRELSREDILHDGGMLQLLHDIIETGSIIAIKVRSDPDRYCLALNENNDTNPEFIQGLLSICKAFNIDPIRIMPFRLMDDKGVQYNIHAEGFDLRQQQAPLERI